MMESNPLVTTSQAQQIEQARGQRRMEGSHLSHTVPNQIFLQYNGKRGMFKSQMYLYWCTSLCFAISTRDPGVRGTSSTTAFGLSERLHLGST